MIFLFDDKEGYSRKARCLDWNDAEQFAGKKGWTLVGRFIAEFEV